MGMESLEKIEHGLGMFGRRAVRKHLPDKKVNAIKEVRRRTKCSLYEAKEYVDLMALE